MYLFLFLKQENVTDLCLYVKACIYYQKFVKYNQKTLLPIFSPIKLMYNGMKSLIALLRNPQYGISFISTDRNAKVLKNEYFHSFAVHSLAGEISETMQLRHQAINFQFGVRIKKEYFTHIVSTSTFKIHVYKHIQSTRTCFL